MEMFTVIFGFLAPMLAKCFGQVSSDTPQQYLRDNYDAASDTFDPGLVADCRPSTMRAIRKARRKAGRKNFPQYSREQVDQITIDSLRKAMSATDEEVAVAVAIAKSMPDED